jgi:4-amino-4-deoxy-L-arabinose transferase-like glycosyltransferase
MSENPNSEYRLLASRYLPYFLLAVILSMVIYARLRLLNVPLERDEGEYAYIGQLLLKGIPPYIQAYSMKLPGVAVMYAIFMVIFGQSPFGIHLGLLIVNGISVLLVYLLADRIMGRDGAIAACAGYAVLSFSQSVMGIAAHATHFANMFILLGLVILLREAGRLSFHIFAAGICFGLAFVMKQHAAIFIVFALIHIVLNGKDLHSRKERFLQSIIFVSGATLPYLLLLVACTMAGGFNQFWFWTVEYALRYASALSITDGYNYLSLAGAIILSSQFPIIGFALIGVAIIFYKKKQNLPEVRFIALFLLLSFLSISPGFYFRLHYFVLLIPAISLLIGYAAVSYGEILPSGIRNSLRGLLCILPMAMIAWGIYNERYYYFAASPKEVSRMLYGNNPFPEAAGIADYIKSHTSTEDRIAVFGSEPEIYFLADRVSVTGHIYMYGLMENQPYAESMQIQMIREVTTGKPKYIVMANVQYSWLIHPEATMMILNWMENYLKQNYQVAGVVDIVDSVTVRYAWDRDAESYTPQSEAFLTLYKRKKGV